MEDHRIFLGAGGLLLCILTARMMQAAAAAAGGAGVPAAGGCRRKCGGVDIPYPFGLDSDGPECAVHGGFQLSCNKTGIFKAFGSATLEVTRISVSDGKAWMNVGISSQCRNTSGYHTEQVWLDTSNSTFWFSSEDNIIVVLGCGTTGYMTGDSYVMGCVSRCDKTPENNGKKCSGGGCCEADLIQPTQYYFGSFDQRENSDIEGCGYTAIMDKTSFSFNTSYINSSKFGEAYKGRTSVVMDWVITNDPCDEAKNNVSSYACRSPNSYCENNSNIGYICKCEPGYQGNPYSIENDGCEDIDECLIATHHCKGKCKNTAGSYRCSCHTIGCIPDEYIPVICVSVGLILMVAATCAYLIKERGKLKHIKQKYFQQHGGLLLLEEMRSKQGVSFKLFSEAELHQATERFNEGHVLGHGGHGTVYKGLLRGHVEVAVKRCVTIDEQQKKEFGREMLILSQINHKSIVKLLGCCLEVEVPMLVYEYIPNGTLFQLIHGDHGQCISLGIRLRIAHESADALAYLHSWASPPILHGDVKSSNILLDGDYRAKVSDFGASILAPTDESQFVTIVQGTCGYLDPEYMQTCQLTDKSDVYSFGVVILELLTGKKAFNLEAPEHEKSLSMRFLSAMKERRLEEILDDHIRNEENIEFLEEVAELAKQCLDMCGENRPSMKEVADKLNRLRMVMQHPWAQQNPEEMESLLGESSSIVSSVVVTTGNFSIEKKAVVDLESGR